MILTESLGEINPSNIPLEKTSGLDSVRIDEVYLRLWDRVLSLLDIHLSHFTLLFHSGASTTNKYLLMDHPQATQKFQRILPH